MKQERRARGVLLALAVAAVVAGVAVAVVRSRDARAPALVFRPHAPEQAAAADDAGDADEDRAMALAVASISPAERRRLLELMRYTTARLEAKLSPLGTDFGDEGGDAVVEFRRAMTAHMPSFNAARAFARGTWTSADLDVRTAASCATPLATGEICVAMWSTDDGPEAKRARFLAWAVTRAAVVDLETRAAAEACARSLRDRSSTAGSPVALVLLDDDLALAPVPESDELKDAARLLGRAMAANDIEDTQHLEAFARASPTGRVAPWLDLPHSGLVAIPRLSAIADPGALVREIETAAGGARLRWVHHP